MDAGIEALRNSGTTASLQWNETDDVWEAGLQGSEIAIARKYAETTNFTAATPKTIRPISPKKFLPLTI